MSAAQDASDRLALTRSRRLPGPSTAEQDDGRVQASVYRATRELLYIGDQEDAMSILADLVIDLGGQVVDHLPAAEEGVAVVLDEEHQLVATAADPEALRRLKHYLPTVVADARASSRVASLAHEADVDALTGLPNRRAADRLVPRLRTGDVVVVIDLDHFKRINDEHGHQAGDEVLTAFGRLLKDHSRAADLYLRVGGEEFLGVFHGQPVPAAVSALQHLRAEWAAAAPRPCSFSAGAAAVHDDDGPSAWRLADRHLYDAKRRGRNRTVA